ALHAKAWPSHAAPPPFHGIDRPRGTRRMAALLHAGAGGDRTRRGPSQDHPRAGDAARLPHAEPGIGRAMPFTPRSATLLVAGLMGVAGVATAAAASHGSDPRLMAGASAMCLAHAPALVALHAAWLSTRAAALAALLLALG